MLKPLPLTNEKPGQGKAVMRFEKLCGRWLPACSLHGPMNKVAADAELWRCLGCNIGVEWVKNV